MRACLDSVSYQSGELRTADGRRLVVNPLLNQAVLLPKSNKVWTYEIDKKLHQDDCYWGYTDADLGGMPPESEHNAIMHATAVVNKD